MSKNENPIHERKCDADESNHYLNKCSSFQPESIQVIGVDGTAQCVDKHAIGGYVDQMPKGYFWSSQFVGTVVVGT